MKKIFLIFTILLLLLFVNITFVVFADERSDVPFIYDEYYESTMSLNFCKFRFYKFDTATNTQIGTINTNITTPLIIRYQQGADVFYLSYSSYSGVTSNLYTLIVPLSNTFNKILYLNNTGRNSIHFNFKNFDTSVKNIPNDNILLSTSFSFNSPESNNTKIDNLLITLNFSNNLSVSYTLEPVRNPQFNPLDIVSYYDISSMSFTYQSYKKVDYQLFVDTLEAELIPKYQLYYQALNGEYYAKYYTSRYTFLESSYQSASFKKLFDSLFLVPIKTIDGLFNFNVFGYDFRMFPRTLFTLALVTFIIRRLL